MKQVKKLEGHQIFKGAFIAKLEKAEDGAVIHDEELKKLAQDCQIIISLKEIQACIRQIEKMIGKVYKIRVIRLRNEGYRVVSGINQLEKATEEGRKKILKAVKKTSARIGAVDVNKLPDAIRQTAISRKMALDSLLHVSKEIMSTHNLEIKDVAVINSAANELKALKMFRGQ